MASRTVYPAMFNSAPATALPQTTAQTQLSNFLAQTKTKPHLHPDALLSSTGVNFSAHSGPTGGLALHHLSRIEAGLRGENLVQETQEELEAVFGEEMRAAGTLRGDDKRLDENIAGTKRARSQERVKEWEDGAEFALGQEIVEGEVGERGDGVVKQGGAPPVLETHTQGGKVDVESRRVAKRARRAEEKKERERARNEA